jgi:hypothetical protein
MAKDELPPLKDLALIREPDKRPIDLERIKCIEEFYLELIQ